MTIDEKRVVSIDYTLKDDDGATIDTSEGREPLSFIFGTGTIIPGLEKELSGKSSGESLSVTVTPEEGYGNYDETLILDVPKDRFEGSGEIQEGVQVQAQREDGGVQIMTVKSVGDDSVTLDGNHPLAGMTLHFDVEVKDVRDASAEELDHGHVH
jgi:FKBP-type peptidyl-prolyl cis-trans isomerase SlyD